ncbi:MAG: helicase-related protein [Candidatus Bathyarchaeia archaeon]
MTPNPLVRADALEEREYQIRIAEEAAKRNTLVVLPTALGKTVIAALAASHFLYNHRDLKVLVMAPTRPLVLQHRDTFLRLLKLRPQDVRVLTGKNPPNYRLHTWDGPHRLYFATPQVVDNDLQNGLRLEGYTLLVFDECHRARKNYAYTRVAESYVEQSPHPTILGLTASPGADRARIREVCEALRIEHIEARAEEDPDVKPYVNPVEVDWRVIHLPHTYQGLRGILKEMLYERLRRLSEMGVVRKNPRYIYRRDLVEAGDEIRYRIEETPLEEERGPLYRILAIQSSALTLYHALELLESQGPHTLTCFLRRIEEDGKVSHRSIVRSQMYGQALEMLESGLLEEHPKVEAMRQAILEQMASKPDSKILVFTQYRDTASHLTSRLKEMGIPAERFIGQADREGDAGLTQDQQAALIEGLRDGDLKALVATSIGEEGLDIPSVDLVVFYEPVPSEIRYIQRKGRTGRRRFGRVVILAAEDTLDTAYLKASRRRAEKMKEIVRGLNVELKPIPRRGPPPSINPMPEEDIAEAEKYAPPIITRPEEYAEPGVELEPEGEDLRMFNREVRYAARQILGETFKASHGGLAIQELTDLFEGEGYTPGVIKAAVEMLCREGQVGRVGHRIYPKGVEAKSMGMGRVYTFEIERIMPGKAILLVDDRWRAILIPTDYDGPRQLVKRGRRFRAASKLYHLNGKLHARIYGITEAETL